MPVLISAILVPVLINLLGELGHVLVAQIEHWFAANIADDESVLKATAILLDLKDKHPEYTADQIKEEARTELQLEFNGLSDSLANNMIETVLRKIKKDQGVVIAPVNSPPNPA